MAKAATTRKPRSKRANPNDKYGASNSLAVVQPSFTGWSEATVLYGEGAYVRRQAPVEVDAVMRRLTQWPLILSSRMAQACVDVPIRWYTKESIARHAEKYGWRTRRVENRKRLKYLRDPSIKGPSAKAAMYAEYAGDFEEVLTGPVVDLTRNPNPTCSPTEFWMAAHMAQDAAGNTYLMCDTSGEKPILLNMQPQWVSPNPDPERFIASYTYGRNRANTITIDADEVMHKQHIPNPWNPYIGMASMQALIVECDIDNASAVRDLAMWSNGARPDFMVMAPPETQPSQLEQAQIALNGRHQGPQNAGKFWVTNAVKVEPLQFDAREMENVARTANIEQRLFAAFGFPESIVKLNTASRANGDAGAYQFALYGVRPRVSSFCEFLTRELARVFGYDPSDMWCAPDNCVPDDEKAINDAQVSLYNAQIITKNEARMELGLDPVDDGDDFKEPPKPAEGFGNAKSDEKPKEDKHLHNHHGKAAGVEVVPDEVDTLYVRLEKAVRTWLLSMSAELTLTPEGYIDFGAYKAAFDKIVTPFIQEIFNSGVESGASAVEMGIPDISGDVAAEWIDRYTIRLANEVTDTVQRDMRKAIAESLQQGNTLAETNRDVAKALREQSGYRAERIARTETSRAYQEGELQSWKTLGITRFKWQLSADACEICVAIEKKCNAEGGWPVGEPILKIGEQLPLPDGKSFSTDYADINTALAHPSCRCKMIAVMDPIPEPEPQAVGAAQ